MSASLLLVGDPSVYSDISVVDEQLSTISGISLKSGTVRETEEQFDERCHVINVEPPLNDELCARFKRSYAYETFRERSPTMLKEIKECLLQNEVRLIEKYGDTAKFDIRRIIWSLDILRMDIYQNNPFKLFFGKEPDTADWNRFLNRLQDDRNRWFTSVWLYAECYLYRRISTSFKRSEVLSNYDYFGQQKLCSARNIIYVMLAVLKATRRLERCMDNLKLILRLSLWANRCDLSNNQKEPDARIVELLDEYDADLLVDDSEEVWRVLEAADPDSPAIVDIVLDNAGFELFSDLILAEYLIETGLARKVRFHVKAIPWFVSDVTRKDFLWMLRFFRTHEIHAMAKFGRKMRGFKRDRSIELCEKSYFWTSPYDFSRMRKQQPCLYVKLSFGILTIVKGDLNYRKLLGDINRDPTDPFIDCLRGFLPSSVLALRTIKSDIYCGLPICTVEWLSEDNPGWMLKGEKGVIQLAAKTIYN